MELNMRGLHTTVRAIRRRVFHGSGKARLQGQCRNAPRRYGSDPIYDR